MDCCGFLTCVFRVMLVVCAGSTTSSSTLQNETELGDDDVFTVRIPLSFLSHSASLSASRRHSLPLLSDSIQFFININRFIRK